MLADGREHVQADFSVEVGPSTLSYHMKPLRRAGIAWSRPEGSHCYVSLRPDLEVLFPGLVDAILPSQRSPVR